MSFYTIADEARSIKHAAQAIEMSAKAARDTQEWNGAPTLSDYDIMAASNALDHARADLDRLIEARRLGERVAA